MSQVQPGISSEPTIPNEPIERSNNEPVLDNSSAAEHVSTPHLSASKDVAAVNTDSDQPQPSSTPAVPASVVSRSPLQGLEEAARQVSEQHVSRVANAQHGPYPQQHQHPIPAAQNARLLAPAPARGFIQQQPIPPSFNPPAQPQVFYPLQTGTPLLMNQCPRCGLRAGEPFQPMYYPNAPYHPPYNPGPQHPLPAKKQNTTIRAPAQQKSLYGPPPPDHPNAHMWVPPPGYIPPQQPPRLLPGPSQTSASSPATGSTYSAVAVTPEAPSYPPRKNPNRNVLAPHIVSSRLPSPPPARRPLTLVGDEDPQEGATGYARDIKGRRRKSEKPYRRRMSRDERRDILLMRKLGYKLEQIARYIGATVSAVNYTVRLGDPEPKHKNAGRKVHIPEERIDAMVAYVKDYMEREKTCPVDKRTKRKTMKHLSYNMIRQAIFADENGEIPAKFKFTDDALKSTLNKRGIYLRAPMSQAMVEIARARGKKMWQDKLDRDRQAAEASAAAETEAGQGEGNSDSYMEAGEFDEDDDNDHAEDEDEDMGDESGEDDAISIPSDAEDGQEEDDDSHEDGRGREHERSDFHPRPQSTVTSFGHQPGAVSLTHGQSFLPR